MWGSFATEMWRLKGNFFISFESSRLLTIPVKETSAGTTTNQCFVVAKRLRSLDRVRDINLPTNFIILSSH